MNRTRYIVVLTIATILSAALLRSGAAIAAWARVVVGIPFIFLLPGHAVMLALDPDEKVGGLERFTLAVGSSISITVVVGLALAATSNLIASAMVVLIAAITLVALIAAWVQEPSPLLSPQGHNSVRHVIVGAFALFALTLLTLALSIPRSATSDSVIQLWGLPDDAGGLRIGARNINASQQRFHLTINQGGRLIAARTVDLPVGRDRLFDVKKSATWTSNAPVIARLTDDSGVLAPRTVVVWTTE